MAQNNRQKAFVWLVLAWVLPDYQSVFGFSAIPSPWVKQQISIAKTERRGWVTGDDGEWEWEEDDPNYVPPKISGATLVAEAAPRLPSGSFHPKQSLGQNYLHDGNTVAKVLRAFHKDATRNHEEVGRLVEMGPGAGALTDRLVKTYGVGAIKCIEIDDRAIEILHSKHPCLRVIHDDVLQVDYPKLSDEEGTPLVVVGNLPYYITSQILFVLADASHSGAVECATVTMQWEVAQRMVAPTKCKDYGILSVVFQLYADVKCHFKIPPTVFYPVPKVDSALIGLHFVGPSTLRKRFAGVDPKNFRQIVTRSFQQRRKTLRKSLKKLAIEICDGDKERAKAILDSDPLPVPASVKEAAADGDTFCRKQTLCYDWQSKRPEELHPAQFVELTRLFYGPVDGVVDETIPLGHKVWRKLKHGD